jgi:outer membrane protein TolC
VSRDTQVPALVRQRASREIALLRLKQLLDVPANYELRLATTLDDESLPAPWAVAPAVAQAEALVADATVGRGLHAPAAELPDRVAVREVETTVRLREAALQLAQAQKLPSVSLTSNYGRVNYPSGFFPAFDDFRTNWTIGANVQVPLLTGGRQRGEEAAARADLDEARARLQHVQELAALDTRSAWTELMAARAAWEASAGTIQQAQRAYEIADVRYRSGVSTQLELSDARLLLQQAETNRAQAARDLQVARARMALLPELPLNQGGPTVVGTPRPLAAPPATPVLPPSGPGQMRTTVARQQAGARNP